MQSPSFSFLKDTSLTAAVPSFLKDPSLLEDTSLAAAVPTSFVSDKKIHEMIKDTVETYIDTFLQKSSQLDLIKNKQQILYKPIKELTEIQREFSNNIIIYDKLLGKDKFLPGEIIDFSQYGQLAKRTEQIYEYIKNTYPLYERQKQIVIYKFLYEEKVKFIEEIKRTGVNKKIEEEINKELIKQEQEFEVSKKKYQHEIIDIQDKFVKQLSTFKNIETEIINYKGTIFALSDIHGDLHAFIIALRDCAKVICKKNLDKDDIDENLNIDISVQDNGFDETFGYEWCGTNTCVVICGDIIDPVRPVNFDMHCKKENLTHCLYYPQIEIKLLRFINAMNKKAIEKGCRIFKILGNHEVRNISIDAEINNKQYEVFRFQPDTVPYYRGKSRKEVFHYLNPGYKLLFEDNCYTLLKINGSIFAHGQLPSLVNLEYIKKINNIMNNYDYFYFSPILYNWLMDRDYGDPSNIATRLYRNEENIFCSTKVEADIMKFLDTENIDNIRVIIGHCPQTNTDCLSPDGTEIPCLNRTYKSIEREESNRIIYNNNEIYIGDGSNKRYSEGVYITSFRNRNTIFGITMSCPKYAPIGAAAPAAAAAVAPVNDFYVYNIDVGSSRAFDNIPYIEINNISNENKKFFSRTPQVLCIDENDRILIIKSTMKNTRIHLPRPLYEEYIKEENIRDLKLDNVDSYGKKYLKYKNKYLLLKNRIINTI